jgi:mRNA-degrading endonuclease RelE of RelBE toxin-antitoxin system
LSRTVTLRADGASATVRVLYGSHHCRLRVGRYRVMYEINGDEVVIGHIARRRPEQ